MGVKNLRRDDQFQIQDEAGIKLYFFGSKCSYILVINRKTYLIEATQFNRIIFFQPLHFVYKLNATILQISRTDIHATAQFHNTSK